MANINFSLSRERFYYLDWLRVFAVVMVFIFHNTHFFDFIDWSVKNNTESPVMMVLFLLIYFWSMPLFFFLAGACTKIALDYKSKKEYVIERIKRLIIPLVVGMLVLAPPQGYVESLSKLQFHGSFINYYPQFFQHLFHNFTGKTIADNMYHLWFLGFLFIFSIIALPLFALLKKNKIQKYICKIAEFSNKKGMIFLFAIPILMSHLILRVHFPDYSGVADFFYWLIYFIYGYVLFSDDKFSKAIDKYGNTALIVAVICLVSIVVFLLSGCEVSWFEYPSYSTGSIVFMAIYSLLTWSWILFMLSITSKLFNFSNKFLKYSNEAVLPFYLLHQTIILVIGFYIVQWNTSILNKFCIITFLSLLSTMAVYDLIVRRFNFTRALFGMKRLKLST